MQNYSSKRIVNSSDSTSYWMSQKKFSSFEKSPNFENAIDFE